MRTEGMCMDLTRPKMRPTTARWNKTVYKILWIDLDAPYGQRLRSPFVNAITWRYDETKIVDEPYWDVTKAEAFTGQSLNFGFHSFRSHRALKKFIQLHKNYLCQINWAVFKCVIPKGAEYYKGAHGQVISNALTVIGQVR